MREYSFEVKAVITIIAASEAEAREKLGLVKQDEDVFYGEIESGLVYIPPIDEDALLVDTYDHS